MSILQNTAPQNIALIEVIFREVQDSFTEDETPQRLFERIKKYEGPFYSVAFEAASMSIALAELKENNSLIRWHSLLRQYALPHAAQFHVGLGWAIAQLQLEPTSLLKDLQSGHDHRVMDGMGYYDGLFRRRKSILQQIPPSFGEASLNEFYNQGLGRSIWYTNKGAIDDVKSILNKFHIERQAALWRGIGIAVTYAGGCTEEMLKHILSKAAPFETQLRIGAGLALDSRKTSGCITSDAALAVKIWNE